MTPELTVDRARLGNAHAVNLYNQSGCLKLTEFIARAKVDRLAKAVAAVLASARADGSALRVGNKRRMIPLPIQGGFDDPDIYAPDEFRTFLTGLYGAKHVLNCFTCVNAEPGAADQHLHRDYEGLFADKIDVFCPSFAINLFIPLVPFNSVNGTTRLWPGSHRKPDTDDAASSGGFIDPVLEPGDALLVDYRLMHGGTANHSAANRPMLCLAYSRDWFFDNRHFNVLNPLQFDMAGFSSRSPADQQLFARAKIYRQMGNP